jgi:hypothetical protein
MGMRMPETCWPVFKRQVINLRSCCILLVDSVENNLDTFVEEQVSTEVAVMKKYGIEIISCLKYTDSSAPSLIGKKVISLYVCDVRGGEISWGTALQAGRSRVQFPMSLDFSLTQSFRPRCGPVLGWKPGWQPCHRHVPIVEKSWEPVQACNGIA